MPASSSSRGLTPGGKPPPRSDGLWVPGGRIGRYQLLAPLASGGMAEIWLARQTVEFEGFSKVLVIKRMTQTLENEPEYVEMFLQEARLAAQLNHPNVVQIFELGQQHGAYFIVMEYVEGESLASIRRHAHTAGHPLPDALVAVIGAQVAEGLHYAHTATGIGGEALNVVHRDVSPQNVLVTFDGSVKVVDFGIAKVANRASISGQLKGKLGYMSPQQGNAVPVDHRSDIFSLGVVLHELLTGKRLFRGSTDIEVLREVISEAPLPRISTFRPDIDAELDQVVATAIERAPERRQQTAQQLQRELEHWLRAHGPAGRPELAAFMRSLFAERISQRRAMIDDALNNRFSLSDAMAVPALWTPSNGSQLDTLLNGAGARAPHPSRLPRLLLAAAVGVLTAAGGWALLSRTSPSTPAAPTVEAVVHPPPRLSVETEPPGAEIVADGAVLGKSPLVIESLAPGEHTVTARLADHRVVEKKVSLAEGGQSALSLMLEPDDAADDPAKHAAPVKKLARGRLNLSTKPWASVFLGKQRLGDTPLKDVSLPAGHHLLRLVNAEEGIDSSIEVEIKANETTFKKLKL
ncbi:MAG: serine/threonine protein kinase [Archangiaceae bacterium]|nr:serine/threonine protein kinase [Archangiaceae bacterium]